MKKFLIAIINLYQKTLSPDHGWFSSRYPGGYCKFHPDCSEYFKQSIEKKGAAKGLVLGVWRVLRCNPWSAGGVDPVK
jgi:putative membrane protein insertion efficiency factor